MSQIVLWHLAYASAFAVVVPAALVFGFAVLDIAWCKNVFRGLDNSFAAVLAGGDGRHSFSAYCGLAMAGKGPAWLCYPGGAIDFIFGAGHCLGAAKFEFPEKFQ